LPGVGRSDRQTKGLVQSVFDVHVLRHSFESDDDDGDAVQAVPVGQSMSVVQSAVQYVMPVVALPRTPPHTVHPAQLDTGTPSGDGAASVAASVDASPLAAGEFELLEQPPNTLLAPRPSKASTTLSETPLAEDFFEKDGIRFNLSTRLQALYPRPRMVSLVIGWANHDGLSG
jgi:hypothetical protein